MTEPKASSDLKFDTAIELLNIGLLINKYMNAEAKLQGINRDYGRILIGLTSYGAMTQTELSELMLWSRQRITLTIDKMEAEGLLQRKALANDRRANQIVITEKGREWVRHTLPHFPNSVIKAIPPGLSRNQLKELGIILSEMRQHLLKQTGLYSGRPVLQRSKLKDIRKI